MKLYELKDIIKQLPSPASPADQQEIHTVLNRLGIKSGEFYQELEMTSRFVDTHQDKSFSNSTVSLHSHSYYEILYCRNSCGAEYLVGSDRYRLQKGDIILVAPGVSHRPLLPPEMTEPYHRDVLWFSTDFVEGMSRLFPEHHYDGQIHTSLLRTAGTKWEYLGELFHAGVQESEQKQERWEAAVLANTVLLLTHLRRALNDKHTTTKAEKPDLLEQVMAFIETNLDQKITLADTAKHFYISESTVSQLFRRKMGVSFYRCVTQRRLIAAKSLILDGAPLESVSEKVGFADYSTFYRAFKHEYGISPRQFRKLQEPSESMI